MANTYGDEEVSGGIPLGLARRIDAIWKCGTRAKIVEPDQTWGPTTRKTGHTSAGNMIIPSTDAGGGTLNWLFEERDANGKCVGIWGFNDTGETECFDSEFRVVTISAIWAHKNSNRLFMIASDTANGGTVLMRFNTTTRSLIDSRSFVAPNKSYDRYAYGPDQWIRTTGPGGGITASYDIFDGVALVQQMIVPNGPGNYTQWITDNSATAVCIGITLNFDQSAVIGCWYNGTEIHIAHFNIGNGSKQSEGFTHTLPTEPPDTTTNGMALDGKIIPTIDQFYVRLAKKSAGPDYPERDVLVDSVSIIQADASGPYSHVTGDGTRLWASKPGTDTFTINTLVADFPAVNQINESVYEYEFYTEFTDTLDFYRNNQFDMWRYSNTEAHESLGVPDGGVSIPALNEFDDLPAFSQYVSDLQHIIKETAGFRIHAATGRPFNWEDGHSSNLYFVSMGDRGGYGATGGAKYNYTFDRVYHSPTTTNRETIPGGGIEFPREPVYDIDLGEIKECLALLEASDPIWLDE